MLITHQYADNITDAWELLENLEEMYSRYFYITERSMKIKALHSVLTFVWLGFLMADYLVLRVNFNYFKYWESDGFWLDQDLESDGFLLDQVLESDGFWLDQDMESDGFWLDQVLESDGFWLDQVLESDGFWLDQDMEPDGFWLDQVLESDGFWLNQYGVWWLLTGSRSGVWWLLTGSRSGIWWLLYVILSDNNSFFTNMKWWIMLVKLYCTVVCCYWK